MSKRVLRWTVSRVEYNVLLISNEGHWAQTLFYYPALQIANALTQSLGWENAEIRIYPNEKDCVDNEILDDYLAGFPYLTRKW